MKKQPIKQPERPKEQKNFAGYLACNTMAIRKHLNDEMRIPVLKRACELLYRFEDYLQMQAINKWVEEFGLSKKLLLGFLNGESKPTQSPSDELRECLLSYDIRQNEITGEITIYQNKKQISMDELKIILDNDNYDLKHLDKLIDTSNKNITVTKLFNPLHDFFMGLAEKYRGESLISELASCIPAMDFGDRDNGFYQKRLEYYFRKWLYKTAGQALDININDAMLLWIEALGGSGKSRINQWLFSIPEFENYYLRIGANDSYMPISRISTGKFLLDFDELPLSAKKYQEYKSSITATKVQDYTKKTGKYENFNRKVNFIGSTNKANHNGQKGYLLEDDDAMKRRIIPIEIFGRIDYERYLKDIDLYQLWGEAAVGIIQAQKSDNKELLTWECDWADMREQNSRYINTKSQDNNIFLNYFKPSAKGEGRFLSCSEILLEIEKKGIKVSISPDALGKYLIKSKFQFQRKPNKRGFWVK